MKKNKFYYLGYTPICIFPLRGERKGRKARNELKTAFFLLFLLFGLFSNNVFSQKYYTTLNLDTVPAPGTYIATESINLLPGFHFKATDSSSFDAMIGIKAQNPCLIASNDNFINNISLPCCGLSSPCELIRVCQNDTFEIKVDTIGYPTLTFYDLTRKFQYLFTNGTNSFSYPSTLQLCNTPALSIKLAIANAGIYYVELKIRDSIGNLVNQIGDSNKIYIEVISNHPNPIVLNVPADTCVGSNLVLTPMINITDPYIHYSFGWDGLETSYFGNYPHIRYQTNCPCPGTYNLWAVVDSGCGRSDTSFYTLKVSTMPDIQYIRNGCMQVDFTGNTCINSNNYSNFINCTWHWNFGDGDTSNIQNPIHTYSDTGTYTITFSITYNDPTSNNCNFTETVTKIITINSSPTPPIIVGHNNNCDEFETPAVSSNYYVSNSTYSSYHWSATYGNIIGSSTSPTVNIKWDTTITNSNPGIISITVSDTNGCTNTAYYRIYACCTTQCVIQKSLEPYVLHDTVINCNNLYLINNVYLKIINGTLTFDCDDTIESTFLCMGPYAKIVVNSGHKLTIINSTIESSCGYMWDGIYVNDGNTTLDVQNSTTISDAINGLVSNNNGIIKLHSTLDTNDADYIYSIINMKNNYYNVKISNATISPYPGYIKNTYFSFFNLIDNHLEYPPLQYTKPLVGVYCDSVLNITIGDSNSSKYMNTFDSLQYGIYAFNSNINVYNNLFSIIANSGSSPLFPTIPSYPDGAIYTTSTALARRPNTLTVGGDGFKRNYFNKCNTGIFSNRYVNNLTKNYIIDCYNGVSLVNIIPDTTSFWNNNTVMINPTYINDNNIYSSTVYAVTPGKGISVRNTFISPFGYNCSIKGNSIVDKQTGISMIGVSSPTPTYSTINNNAILYNVNGPNEPAVTSSQSQCGISVSNSYRLDISNNNIARTFPIVDNNGDYNNIKGIWVENSLSNNVYQNYLTNMGNGIYTYGGLTSTQFNCNTFDHNYFGFRFTGLSGISNQGIFGGYNPCDKWTDVISAPPHKRMHEDPLGLNGSFTYYYDSNAVQMYHPFPFFGIQIATNNPGGGCLCTDNGPGYLGPVSPISTLAEREMVLGQIVRNQLVFDTLQTEYTTMAREYTYRLLTNDTSIIYMGDTSDYVYIAFYNSMLSSDAAHYINAIAAIDTNDLVTVQSELNMIADTNRVNDNRITVGYIYLNTWASGNYELTDEQVRTLEEIAYLDPNTNGDAVYTARVMLNIDPYAADVKSAIFIPHPKDVKPNMAHVYPNPTNTQITIEFNDVISSNAIVEIFGSMGNLVLKDYIQQGNYMKNINVSKLNAGIYFYRITINGSKVSSDKLIILNK